MIWYDVVFSFTLDTHSEEGLGGFYCMFMCGQRANWKEHSGCRQSIRHFNKLWMHKAAKMFGVLSSSIVFFRYIPDWFPGKWKLALAMRRQNWRPPWQKNIGWPSPCGRHDVDSVEDGLIGSIGFSNSAAFCRRAVASMEIEVFLLRAVLLVIGTTYCKLNFQCVQALQTLRSKYPYHFLLLIWSVAVCKRCFPVMAELSAAMLALGQPHPELCTELPMIHVAELRVEKVSCRVEQIGFAALPCFWSILLDWACFSTTEAIVPPLDTASGTVQVRSCGMALGALDWRASFLVGKLVSSPVQHVMASTTESCESVIKSRRGIPEFVRFKFACSSGTFRYSCVWFRYISLYSKLFSHILDGPNLSRRSLGQEVDSSDWACEPSWSERERIRWALSELWQWVIKEKPPAWYWDILSTPYSGPRLIFCFLGTLVNTPRQKSFWQHKRRNI